MFLSLEWYTPSYESREITYFVVKLWKQKAIGNTNNVNIMARVEWQLDMNNECCISLAEATTGNGSHVSQFEHVLSFMDTGNMTSQVRSSVHALSKF